MTGGYGEESTASFTEESPRSSREEFQELQEETETFERTTAGGKIGMGLRSATPVRSPSR